MRFVCSSNICYWEFWRLPFGLAKLYCNLATDLITRTGNRGGARTTASEESPWQGPWEMRPPISEADESERIYRLARGTRWLSLWAKSVGSGAWCKTGSQDIPCHTESSIVMGRILKQMLFGVLSDVAAPGHLMCTLFLSILCSFSMLYSLSTVRNLFLRSY